MNGKVGGQDIIESTWLVEERKTLLSKMSAKPYGDFVKKGRPWYKIVSPIIFSRFGLFILCMSYAVGGERQINFLSHALYVM